MRFFKTRLALDAARREQWLSRWPGEAPAERIVFWDIETTGLSRMYDSVYLAGYLYLEDGEFYEEQLLASGTPDELDLLEDFRRKAERFDLFVSYNGDSFDLPFMMERLRRMHLPSCREPGTLDLYREIRPLAGFLGLGNCRLKTVEQFLGIHRHDQMGGAELIDVFYEYSRTGDPALEKTLLLHNYEDILNLPELLVLRQYLLYLQSEPALSVTLRPGSDTLEMIFEMASPPPMAHETIYPLKKSGFSVGLRTDPAQGEITLRLPLLHDTLRYYLPNYRDYYVLPNGQLMHKSLGTPPDKKQASREEACLEAKDIFVPLPPSCALEGLHLFRQNCRDRSGSHALRELTGWAAAADADRTRTLLNIYLPF
ncbi:MAG: ribonuclease H-like domain-containing protein [Firmicutes bacterium]|nr:ribonuclease H-like domain-containing protein [Bacillota bacterium]